MDLEVAKYILIAEKFSFWILRYTPLERKALVHFKKENKIRVPSLTAFKNISKYWCTFGDQPKVI